jgi:hypothetical protein
MGRACSTYKEEDESIQDFGEIARRNDDLEVGGRIILKWILER